LLVLVSACSGLYNYEHVQGSHVVREGDTLYSIAWEQDVDYRDLAAWNNLSNPDRIYVGQRLVLSPRASGPVSGPVAQLAARPPVQIAAPPWQWPVRGTVVTRFGTSGTLSSGIGIAASTGAEIRAAAAGVVVYAGSGLRDYGQLVIIEHNANWLSAYGHNRRLLVAEGESVAQGQRIAEMGPGPGGSPRLHFEIRRNGDPVDPVSLLPRE
jgi:lipoprotein NlpD